MKIIITGGKSAQSFKILKAFKDNQVLLADYGEMPSFPSTQYSFISLGEKNDNAIAHQLLNSCLDHEADYLLPLYPLEIEAVVKSSTLFEEFNIHMLLPDADILSLYYKKGNPKSNHWAIYDRGELICTSAPWLPIQEHVLSGAFYLEEKTNMTTLFVID